jgi:uncharacterized protein YehS (DUF1456 family)
LSCNVRGYAAGQPTGLTKSIREIRMTNNDILKKLRIALNLKDTDIIDILKLADFEITKTELSALFRKEGHKNYKECGDQILRRFLNGLIIRNRGKREQ